MSRQITTEKEALKKAQELWGENARVLFRIVKKKRVDFSTNVSSQHHSFAVGVNIKIRVLWSKKPVTSFDVKGVGTSWKGAFKSALDKEESMRG